MLASNNNNSELPVRKSVITANFMNEVVTDQCVQEDDEVEIENYRLTGYQHNPDTNEYLSFYSDYKDDASLGHFLQMLDKKAVKSNQLNALEIDVNKESEGN